MQPNFLGSLKVYEFGPLRVLNRFSRIFKRDPARPGRSWTRSKGGALLIEGDLVSQNEFSDESPVKHLGIVENAVQFLLKRP